MLNHTFIKSSWVPPILTMIMKSIIIFSALVAVAFGGPPVKDLSNLKASQFFDGYYCMLNPTHSGCLKRSSDYISGGLSDAEKTIALQKHNYLRANVTPKPADMQYMHWDDYLAFEAQNWAEQCKDAHDGNMDRALYGLYTVGQNLAKTSTIDSAINSWYDEKNFFKYGVGRTGAMETGHFTQVVWATSSHLGCGYASCKNIGHLFICNYARAGNENWRLAKPYDEGSLLCKGKAGIEKDSLCDCGGKVCDVGYLDVSTCQCKCDTVPNFTKNCKFDCAKATDKWFCGTKYLPIRYCAAANVPGWCPITCGACKDGKPTKPSYNVVINKTINGTPTNH